MPFAFKGFGTKYYGEAERRPDGSFITTEWIVAAYAPLIPLGTARICRDPANDLNIIVVRSDAYLVIEKLPLSWAQVGKTYAFVACCFVWWSLTIWLLFFKASSWANENLLIAVLAYIVIAAMPFFALRRLQRESYSAQYREK
jgi:hypothetical protein